MMPFIQGEPNSVPAEYREGYADILRETYIKHGDIGFLTIDESKVLKNTPHRGARRRFDRALHTEAGRHPGQVYGWGSGGGWGSSHLVVLDRDVKVLLSNSIDRSCAIWNSEHENTSLDGDIGDCASSYPYEDAILMMAGEVHEIGILTPHESIAVTQDIDRQFLRIISSGVHGRELYFTENPLMAA